MWNFYGVRVIESQLQVQFLPSSSLEKNRTLNPEANFFPMNPNSSPPSGELSVLLIHQISGLPEGAAKLEIKILYNKM